MFRLAQVIGDGTPTQIISFDANFEGSMHSIYTHNTIGSPATVTFDVAGKSVEIDIPIGGAEVPFRFNVPVNSVVTVSAPVGVTVNISYTEIPVDAGAALNAAQETIALLQNGTINNSTVGETTTFSSSEIVTRLAQVEEANRQSSLTNIIALS